MEKKNIVNLSLNALLVVVIYLSYANLSNPYGSESILIESAHFWSFAFIISAILLVQNVILSIFKAYENQPPSFKNAMILSSASPEQKEILKKFLNREETSVKIKNKTPALKELINLDVIKKEQPNTYILREEFRTPFKKVSDKILKE